MNQTDRDGVYAIIEFIVKDHVEKHHKGYQPTLRDQFAMAALTGMLAACPHPEELITRRSNTAYEYADAMLKARAEYLKETA